MRGGQCQGGQAVCGRPRLLSQPGVQWTFESVLVGKELESHST